MTEGYTQTVTYWAQGSVDGYGKRTFATPVAIDARWEDKSQLVVNERGEEVPSKARVYILQDVEVGDYLALGDLTAEANPEAREEAKRVLAFSKTPSIDGSEYTRKAML